MEQHSAPPERWIAQLIRGARTRVGYDGHHAAHLLNVSPGYLLELEMGLQRPSVLLARRIAGTFGMPADEAAELLAAAGEVQVEPVLWQRV